MKRWKLFLPLAFFLTFCVLLYKGLFLENKTELPSALLNNPLPEFQLTTLNDPQQTVTRNDVTGEVFLLNVWGSWCPSCRAEHPYLLALQEQGARIIGLNYKDDRTEAQQWLQHGGDPYQLNIFDPQGKLGLDLGVYGSPETFLVDKAGVIRYKHVGVVDNRVWEETLKPRYELLQEEAAP